MTDLRTEQSEQSILEKSAELTKLNLEIGRFASGFISRLRLPRPNPPKYDDDQKNELSGEILKDRKVLFSNRATSDFRTTFQDIQRFARKYLEPMFDNYPNLSLPNKVVVAGLSLDGSELSKRFLKDQRGLETLKYIGEQLESGYQSSEYMGRERARAAKTLATLYERATVLYAERNLDRLASLSQRFSSNA